MSPPHSLAGVAISIFPLPSYSLAGGRGGGAGRQVEGVGQGLEGAEAKMR